VVGSIPAKTQKSEKSNLHGFESHFFLTQIHTQVIKAFAFITCHSNLGPLLEGLCNPYKFEISVFGVFAAIEPTTSGLTILRSDQLN